ncbi:MAG: GNAT family N-acetyltransferase, partial [Devosiaceae bacterium]|nr:GNAT family N-acetyltransferase [Devosiaceae bacterium]
GIQSPGQSIDFTKAWIKRFQIPVEDQLYVTREARGKVVALLPLKRVRRSGVDILTWFAGYHVGCNAPLIDHAVFDKLSFEERKQVWSRMRRTMIGADLVCLQSLPDIGEGGYFSTLGQSIDVEVLYRSEYESWEACKTKQLTRSRRKHDKQQGAKLAAIGEVSFEELRSGDARADKALTTLFAQKARRFEHWGIDDPFADEQVQKFYRDMFHENKGLSGKLHVLSLDNEIVAVRYNLAQGNRIFSLISSMSDRADLRPGSPGKQNILRAMQAIFEGGYAVCDMGAGYSDEKRHWCNKTIKLRTHYIPLNTKGALVARLHRLKYRVRKFIKEKDWLFNLVKLARSSVKKTSKR